MALNTLSSTNNQILYCKEMTVDILNAGNLTPNSSNTVIQTSTSQIAFPANDTSFNMLPLSITPISNLSKVKVELVGSLFLNIHGADILNFQLSRTILGVKTPVNNYRFAAGQSLLDIFDERSVNFSYIDSPNTTDSVTYSYDVLSSSIPTGGSNYISYLSIGSTSFHQIVLTEI
jgi:hypothetical protein